MPRGDVRPTSERARQAYFNIVNERIRGARFLDLFAGSGIFSFEALSRGAAGAVAVDSSKQNLAAIAKKAEDLGVTVRTILADAASPGGLPGGPFDIVYADPPYDFDRYDELLVAIDKTGHSDDAVVAVEHRRRTSPFTVEPPRLAFWRRADYGEVWISFFRAEEVPGLQ